MTHTTRIETQAGEVVIEYSVDLQLDETDAGAVTLDDVWLETDVDLLLPFVVAGCDAVRLVQRGDGTSLIDAAERWLDDHAGELWREARDADRDAFEEARAEWKAEGEI